MRASLPRFARALALFSTIALGCIPSHRMVHDGDVYFERCYGADFNVHIAQPQREACWQAWIAHYTKHQPTHRVDYALRRLEALSSGEPAPLMPGMVVGAIEGLRSAAELRAIDAAVQEHRHSIVAATTEGDGGLVPNGCLPFCNYYESTCNTQCQGANPACISTCQRERAICLHGCY